MEEEDELALLDYRTPKGQLIKLLEKKKPEIDGSLGKVLDQFSQLTNDETTYLDNGIFQTNFAEDALLLQSCGQYYGKCVDKLWDDLLQFHTRMVKYDETTAKNCTDSGKREARKRELEKLEERLNRGKRKKIKLTEPETEAPQNGVFVFDNDPDAAQELFDRPKLLLPEEEVEEAVLPFEHNFEMFDNWHEIHRKEEKQRKRHSSDVVSQFNQQKYRSKHYSLPYGDEIIYDWNDPEEFNTRAGRLISVHHIRHIFEYNDQCLLPDEHLTIAKLRFAYVLKKKWLVEHKIDAGAPYETYKEDYEKYQRDYFENEKRKIQNMPQRNSEELMKFYRALAKKERLAKEAQEKLRQAGVKDLPAITFESLILDPLKEGYQGDYDPYIPSDDEEPDESEHTDGDHEVELSNLFVDMTVLPGSSAEAADKLRSDSGYFDGGFEADDESDHEDNTGASVPGTDTPFEFDKDNAENTGGETTEESTLNTSVTESMTMAAINLGAEVEVAENDTTEANDGVEAPHDGSLVTPIGETQSSDTPIGETQFSDTPAGDRQEVAASTSSEIDLNDEQSCIEGRDSASIENEEMNRAIREFVKLGTVDEEFNYSILENSFFRQTDDIIMILYNKEGEVDEETDDENSRSDQVFAIGVSVEKLTTSKSKSKKDSEANVADKKQSKENEESRKRKLEGQGNDPLPKRRKLSLKQIQKLRKSLIDPVKEQKWESFFSMNYQTETGEGEITRTDAYASESEDEDDQIDDENQEADDDKTGELSDLNVSGDRSDHDASHTENDSETPLPLSQDSGIGLSQDSGISLSQDSGIGLSQDSGISLSQDSGIGLSQDSGIMDTSTNSLGDCPSTTEKEPIKVTTSIDESVPFEFSNIDLIGELSKNTGISREELAKRKHAADKPELTPYEKEREEVRERVAEWKDYITPKLKKLDEHDFDIHEYGSKIMDGMNVNESKHFGEMVTGKSSAEVVRYFISSLQLANTLNVEICGAKTGQLSNDTFELKLLSKERYHEHFFEYQAPSEECLREKLQKVKEIRMQNKLQMNQSNTKRRATVNTSVDHSPTQQFKLQSIMKKRSARSSNMPLTSASNDSITLSSPSKKIKILNYKVISSNEQQQQQQLPVSPQILNYEFQQPSTSQQADIMTERQNEPESPISDVLSPMALTPSRSSIDSGFMPSCDEDFLDQFDQLQQTSGARLRSTPIKPRKVLRVSFARNTNF